MNTKARYLLIGTLVLLALGVAGWWFTRGTSPHEHELIERKDALGQVYYSCPMHPQVRRDAPGNCPICGMKLVQRKDASSGEPVGSSGGVLYWYDPMRPDQHFDAPGKSPFMDMQLVPKYADADGDEGVRIQIDPRMVQNLGIRTAPVTRGVFWQRIDATGRVEVDERTLHNVSVRSAGWVEALNVRTEGVPVKRGELLAEIYGVTFDTAQREFVLALESGERSLIDGARGQLRALGFDASQIVELESSRAERHLRVFAPIDGYVMKLMAREGGAVTPDTPLFQLVSHDPLWVIADVPEAQAAWIEAGRQVEVRVPAHPGEVFTGTVDYVYPELDTATRTRRARIVLPNADVMLHPGMYAEVVLYGGGRPAALLAPSEAVVRTGHRNVVIVAEEAGRYRPVEVILGAEDDDHIVVLEGLAEGDRVVVSGQFLIDSEASLLGAYNRMQADDSPAGRMRLMGAEGGPAPYGDTVESGRETR